ncbi:Actin- protein 2/3 complex subunit 2 [Aphanomyces cochlioides]|nr:Actin- protein 2/3 complex subunit 2 [Aphanomyces cochlioides]
MIFLDNESKIVQEVLLGRLGEQAPRPVEPLEIRLCDFDDVQYDISIQGTTLTVSMAYRPYIELQKFGAANMLAKVYPEFQVVAPKPGFELTLVANVDTITPQNAANVVDRIAMLKRNVLSAPFDHCFLALHAGQANVLSPIQIPFRRQETIYVLPQADRVVIVFSVAFQDKTDQAIARVFLQEFAEARRHVNNAPPVSFGKDPPLELRAVSGLRPSADHVGYLSFGKNLKASWPILILAWQQFSSRTLTRMPSEKKLAHLSKASATTCITISRHPRRICTFACASASICSCKC